MKNNKVWIIITIILIIVVGVLVYCLNKEKQQCTNMKENEYNMALYEVVDYVQDVKMYLAKAMISKTAEHEADMLTHVWKESNLAQSYLGMLPVESQKLENTEKFLNQVSEYSYYLSRKNIEGNAFSEDETNKVKELYDYSKDLSNTLNEMLNEVNAGTIKWSDLTNNKEGSDIAEIGSFKVVENNFHEYSGLIYDGAFSEHIISAEKMGLTGDDIDEEQAKQKAEEFVGKDKIKNTQNNGYVENGNIPVYRFEITTNEDKKVGISISKKGGHIVSLNYDREVNDEKISEQDAVEKGKEYLSEKGYDNMKETYYLKENGFITVNYAYNQDNVVMYADLIKVKIALDNGEILGIETTGYLNSHTQRTMSQIKVSKEEAKAKINKNLQIESERLAIIPTEFQTEIMCWEFKGRVDDREFLVYINVETGKEEDILVILNSDEGTLTM